MCDQKGFTLVETIIVTLLMGIVILTATSAEMTSRQFFQAAEDKIAVQDEAKLAMEHIAKNVVRGIGDFVNPGFALFGPTNRIRVQIDGLTGPPNGRYGDAVDGMIEYEVDTVNHRIVFDPDTAAFGDKEDLTDDIIADGSFEQVVDAFGGPNEVLVTIVARRDPTSAASLQNPEFTLITRIVLRAMSCN